jgi:hypothetical protein
MRTHGGFLFVAALAVFIVACASAPRHYGWPASAAPARPSPAEGGAGRTAEKESPPSTAKANGKNRSAKRSAPPGEVQPPESVLWNFWVVDDASAKPVDAIAPGDVVKLQIDLSTVFFGQAVSLLANDETLTATLLQRLKLGMEKTSLNLVVVPDAVAFEEAPSAVTIDVDLQKLAGLLARQRAGTLPASVDDVDATLAYSVGRRPVRLSVKGGAAKGAAPVVISVWDEDWSRPVDEITVVFDIGGARPLLDAARSVAFGALGGPTPGSAAPDAAIHFVAPGGVQPVQAIFRKRGDPPGSFRHWSLVVAGAPVTGERLVAELTAISNALGAATSGDVLMQEGRVLHDLLFPGEGASVLSAFLAKQATPPTLFVRALDPARSGLLAVPLAFVRRSATSGFLGDDVSLETPLELRPLAKPAACVSSWAILLPPAGTDTAMDLILDGIGAEATPKGGLRSWANASVAPNDDIASFRRWVTEDAASSSSVLLIASHQAHDTFSFRQNPSPDASFDVRSFRRTFSSPSIAVLAGCDTGGPDASRIIRRLNRQGFTSIIATSTPANGAVLGRFLGLFAKEITAHSGDPIGKPFDHAVRSLRSDTSAGKALSARALQMTLLGDRSVPVCPPQ